MANMGYCRFENTVRDMEDCLEHIDDFDREEASDKEGRAFDRFMEIIEGEES